MPEEMAFQILVAVSAMFGKLENNTTWLLAKLEVISDTPFHYIVDKLDWTLK
jgi:hypothetical protein